MYGLLWSDNIKNLESEGANNPNIEKISFKVVQIKLLVLMYLQ